MTASPSAASLGHAASDLTAPLPLAQALIRCPSVTPEDAGALDVLASALGFLGFTLHDLPFTDPTSPPVRNLYARLGDAGPVLCFAGHTDVVPPGSGWTTDPFGAEVREGVLYGRGASDMKAAIAAFVAACARLLQQRGLSHFPGSVALLITGDEEGPAVNGTVKVLDWLAQRGERLDHCIVGEPTNPHSLGEMMKVGRRGSLNGVLTVYGTQGHVAYPHLADNPIRRLVSLLAALQGLTLDAGTPLFQPSNLEVVTVDVGNSATNLIPAQAEARFNIRFNDLHTGASLERLLRETLRAVEPDGGLWRLEVAVSGEAFLTPPGVLSDLLTQAAESVTGRRPDLSTSGGTSDARFIKNACPVVEFGLVGQTMHKADERCRVDDLEALTEIYRQVLERYFFPQGGQ